MKLYTFLCDLADIIGKAPNIERILIGPTECSVSFRAVSEDTSGKGRYVVFGKTNDNVDYIDQEFGIQNLSHIGKVISAPRFMRLTAQAYIDEIKWTSSHKNLRIENNQGECVRLGLLANESIDLHMAGAKFRFKSKLDFNTHFRPSGADLEALKYWMKVSNNFLADDFLMTPYIENGKLYLKVGMCEENSIKVKFADRLNGALLAKHVYEGDVFHSLASMTGEVKDLICSFSDQGVCRIRILTPFAEYNFILPALLY